jgi:hypothetical protein
VVMLHPAAAAMKLGFLPLRGSPAHAEHRQECSAGPKRETGCTQRHSEPAPVKWKLDAAGAARNEHMETTALASRQRDMACCACHSCVQGDCDSLGYVPILNAGADGIEHGKPQAGAREPASCRTQVMHPNPRLVQSPFGDDG